MQYLTRCVLLRGILSEFDLIPVDLQLLLSTQNEISFNGIIHYNRTRFKYHISAGSLQVRLPELVSMGYLNHSNQLYTITPLGLLTLHKIEKRLKEARIPKK